MELALESIERPACGAVIPSLSVAGFAPWPKTQLQREMPGSGCIMEVSAGPAEIWMNAIRE
jgi:hypothetical protein